MRKIDTRDFVRATRGTPRAINRQIMLTLLREHQPLSRAELARRMGIGRGMITALVDELRAEGAIYEGATVDAPRGRKPQMLYVRTQNRLAIGVDIRISRTSIMLADFAGTPLAVDQFDTDTNPADLLTTIAARIAALRARHDPDRRCEGIGVVVPGMTDQRGGRVLFAPQLGWRDVAVRDTLADATGLPVQIENAPTACALAQLWLGTGHGEVPTDFVYLSVSDGVGAGIVVNGAVVRGATDSAGEFGHLPLSLDGPRCACGAQGCLEAYTSNLATVSRYLGAPMLEAPTRVAPRHTAPARSTISMADVLHRAACGEILACDTVRDTARYLGLGVAGIIHALNPAQIIIGGEIISVWELIEPVIRDAIASRALTTAAAATPMLPDPSGDHPRLRGAAALIAAPVFAAPRLA